MAIWQFQCKIIPSRRNIDKLTYDEMISWKGISYPIVSINFLERKKVGQQMLFSTEKQMEHVLSLFIKKTNWRK